MLKRISSIVLTVVMLLSMFGTLVVASADPALPQLVLTSDDADGKLERGQTLTVTVSLANYKTGSSIYIELPFDSTLFADVAIKSTNSLTVPGMGTFEVPFVSDASFVGNLDNGTIKALWASTSAAGNFSADVTTFCILTFTVKDDAPIAAYELNAAIKEYYYFSAGSNPLYVAGTDYTEAAEALPLEVACEHDYTNVAWAKPADGTAEADAKHTRACTKCGTPEAVACSFDTVTVPEDCDNNGTVTKTCTVCQYAIVDTIDLIDGHAWGTYTNTEVGGVMTHKRVCGNDATHIEEAACTFVKNDAESVAPTCTVGGKDVEYCTVCNYKKETPVAATGHTYDKRGDGTTPYEHTCTVAGCALNAGYVACTFVPDGTPTTASCTVPGEAHFRCECGNTKVEYSTLPHSFTTYTVSTTEADKHVSSCDYNCGTQDVKDCAYVDNTPADCLKAATKKCTVCLNVVDDATKPALGHNEVIDPADPGTCTVDGKTEGKHCDRCQAVIVPQEPITAPGHQEVKDTVASYAPTCTVDGKDVFKCANCTEYSREEILTAPGHSFTKNDGAETHDCAECDVADNIPCVYDKVIQTATCVRDEIKECACGRRQITPAAGEHPEDKIVTVYTAPSADAEGSFVYHCNACAEDLLTLEEIPAGEPYTDIAAEDGLWYYDSAIFSYGVGIMEGTYGEFLGDDEVTRGMIVTVLGRTMFGGDEIINSLSDQEFEEMLAELSAYYEHEANELKDLHGAYYDRYALALAAMGIVLGDDEGNFNGDDIATREELAVLMVRYLSLNDLEIKREIGEAATFSDMADVSLWAAEDVAKAGQLGLFQGIDGAFKPQNTAKRSELATLMERVIRAVAYYPIVDAE